MFRFADPNFLYLLILLPFLVALYLYSNYHRRQNIRKYGDPALLKGLMPTISKYRPDIKFWLTFAALTLVILMLARPQFGSKMETVKRSGVEAVIALDISNSMLAEDVTPSRLDKSKKLISRLVDTFNNDKVGLIVFAGDAFTQLPITSDYVSAKMFLETINPSLITTQGTDIGAAIRLAMKKEKKRVAAELQLHSDQGFQYTSQAYFNLTQAYGITPSMSRRGNPYDNAMAENFFSMLKTECIYRHKPATFAQANEMIDRYIHFYNHERIQYKTGVAPLSLRHSA